MGETNGQQPAIQIFWDENNQTIAVQHNPHVVKNPHFAAMLCKVAEEELQAQVRMLRVQAMQVAAAQAAQDQALASKIMRGK